LSGPVKLRSLQKIPCLGSAETYGRVLMDDASEQIGVIPKDTKTLPNLPKEGRVPYLDTLGIYACGGVRESRGACMGESHTTMRLLVRSREAELGWYL
jgi:hypothetical protein